MCDSTVLQWGCEKHRPRVTVWISTCRDDMQVPASSRTSTRSGCGRTLMFNSVSELQELWQSCLKALARPNTSESLNVAAQTEKHKSLLHRRIMCHLVLSCLSISKILSVFSSIHNIDECNASEKEFSKLKTYLDVYMTQLSLKS